MENVDVLPKKRGPSTAYVFQPPVGTDDVALILVDCFQAKPSADATTP